MPMKTFQLIVCGLLLGAPLVEAQKITRPAEPLRRGEPAPPPVYFVRPAPPPPAPPPPGYQYEQVAAPGRPYLVTPEQAQQVVDRFREAYAEMGNPRILIYVNRELVDQESGVRLSARTEQVQTIRGEVTQDFQADPNAPAPPGRTNGTISGSVVLGNVQTGGTEYQPGRGTTSGQVDRITNRNTYRVRDRKQPTLADRQTVRDVERLLGRPLRMGGATLVDQRVAAQLIGDKPLSSFTVQTEGEQARKDRESINQIADVVLEVLISSRTVAGREVSGERNHTVPDIQVTAIRLSDSKIIGQATSSDLLGPERTAWRVARNFDVREITEATALALVEDIAMAP
jgi:hypothetical protein